MRPCTRLVALLGVVVLVAGCSSNGEDTSAGEVSTTEASSTTTAATTTTSAPTTTAPTTTTTAASTTTTQAGDADVWDLVYMSDSHAVGRGCGYATASRQTSVSRSSATILWVEGLPAGRSLKRFGGSGGCRRLSGSGRDRPVDHRRQVIIVYGDPPCRNTRASLELELARSSREAAPVCDSRRRVARRRLPNTKGCISEPSSMRSFAVRRGEP